MVAIAKVQAYMTQGISDTIEAICKIGAALGVVFAACRWGWPFLVRAWRAYLISDSIYINFGPDAGKKIQATLLELDRKTSLSEIKQHIVAKHLGLGIYVCDANGSCIASNDVLCELFGLSEYDMKGYGWLKAVKDSKTCFDHWRFCVTNEIPYRYEYCIVHEGKAEAYATTEAYPVKTPDGKATICYVGFVIKKA